MEKSMTVEETLKSIEKVMNYFKEKIESGDYGSETFNYNEELDRLSKLHNEINYYIEEY